MGDRTSLALEMTNADSRGNVTLMVTLGYVTLDNNVYERRRRHEFDAGLPHEFRGSLGATFRLPGVITLPRDVPRDLVGIIGTAFMEWIERPIAELFTDENGHHPLYPTGFVTSVQPLVSADAGDDFILRNWTYPMSSPQAPELWAYWKWDQTSPRVASRDRQKASRLWPLNLSVGCSLHNALTHFWEHIASHAVRRATGRELPPWGSQFVHRVTDFEDEILWDRQCYPELWLSSTPVFAHEMAPAEKSSSLVAEPSTLTAIAQASQSFHAFTKDFTAPLDEAKSLAEDLSKDSPALVSASQAPAACVTNPAVDARLAQEVFHLFNTKSSMCQAHNTAESILSHAATIQWMYDYHRRWKLTASTCPMHAWLTVWELRRKTGMSFSQDFGTDPNL